MILDDVKGYDIHFSCMGKKFHLKSKNLKSFTKLNELGFVALVRDGEIKGLYNRDEKKAVLSMSGFPLELRNTGLEDWDVSEVTDFTRAFYKCSFNSLDLRQWKTSCIEKCSEMFYECQLKELKLPVLDLKHCTDFSFTFCGCSKLESLDLSDQDFSEVKDMRCMFCGCSDLKEVKLGKAPKGSVNLSEMFSGCNSLVSIDMNGLGNNLYDEVGCQRLDLSNMFYLCRNLKELDLSGWDLSKRTHILWNFPECVELEYVNFSGLKTNKIFEPLAFKDCKKLKKLNFSYSDFKECNFAFLKFITSLQEIDVTGCSDKIVSMVKQIVPKQCKVLTGISYMSLF